MLKFYKAASINLISNIQPVYLNQLYKTRAILLKFTIDAGATGAAAYAWTDPFSTLALSIKNLQLQIGNGTPVNVSGQLLAYLQYINGKKQAWQTTTNVPVLASHAITAHQWLPIDMSLAFSGHPIDTMITPDQNLQLLFTPNTAAGAAGGVFTNAGGLISNLYLDIYQVFDMNAGEPKGFRPAQKWLTMYSKALTASSTGQDIIFSVKTGNRISKIILLVGSGVSGAVIPADGLNALGVDIGGFLPVPYAMDATVTKAFHFMANEGPPSWNDLQATTIAAANVAYTAGRQQEDCGAQTAANSFLSTPLGVYPIYAASPQDTNQINQYWPISNSGINRVTVDTNSAGTLVDMLVESVEIPPKPVATGS